MAAANRLLDHLCANASSDVALFLTWLHFLGFGLFLRWTSRTLRKKEWKFSLSILSPLMSIVPFRHPHTLNGILSFFAIGFSVLVKLHDTGNHFLLLLFFFLPL